MIARTRPVFVLPSRNFQRQISFGSSSAGSEPPTVNWYPVDVPTQPLSPVVEENNKRFPLKFLAGLGAIATGLAAVCAAFLPPFRVLQGPTPKDGIVTIVQTTEPAQGTLGTAKVPPEVEQSPSTISVAPPVTSQPSRSSSPAKPATTTSPSTTPSRSEEEGLALSKLFEWMGLPGGRTG